MQMIYYKKSYYRRSGKILRTGNITCQLGEKVKEVLKKKNLLREPPMKGRRELQKQLTDIKELQTVRKIGRIDPAE
jgi:hypothetical protein